MIKPNKTNLNRSLSSNINNNIGLNNSEFNEDKKVLKNEYDNNINLSQGNLCNIKKE